MPTGSKVRATEGVESALLVEGELEREFVTEGKRRGRKDVGVKVVSRRRLL